jgi:hypothetical protein
MTEQQYNPLVRPQATFDQLRLDNARLQPHEQLVLHDPAERFCTDRFKLMTARQQAELLADIAMIRQGREREGVPVSFELSTMRAHLSVGAGVQVARTEATDYYLDYPSKGRYLWLQQGIKDEQVREVVLERHFDDLRTQLPAIAFTLNHLYRGGYYGLLTAREDRDTLHTVQVETISEMFGFSPQTELVYYVNDPVRSKRLAGNSTAVKKATVLTNFANGMKEDEHGLIEPMTVGRRFNEIIFIDDEDKNLKAVMHCLIRGVYASVMDAVGVKYRTPELESALSARALTLSDEEFSKKGVAATHSMAFWVSVVDKLLSKHTSITGEHKNRETLIANLIKRKRWMPEVIKVYDGRKMDLDSSIEGLKQTFAQRSPVVMGTKDSIVFNDIDRTILTVNALFYVREKGNPNPLYALTQAQFGEHPTEAFWVEQTAEKHGLDPKSLEFGWDHFRNTDRIRMDILEALYKGQIAQNPHGVQ